MEDYAGEIWWAEDFTVHPYMANLWIRCEIYRSPRFYHIFTDFSGLHMPKMFRLARQSQGVHLLKMVLPHMFHGEIPWVFWLKTQGLLVKMVKTCIHFCHSQLLKFIPKPRASAPTFPNSAWRVRAQAPWPPCQETKNPWILGFQGG
jgi:hypothetical protein